MLVYDWRYQTLGQDVNVPTDPSAGVDLSVLAPPAAPDLSVVSTVVNPDSTSTITYSDGSTQTVGTPTAAPSSASAYTGPPVVPDAGTGPAVNVISTVVNPDNTTTLTYSDGSTQTVGTPIAASTTQAVGPGAAPPPTSAFADFLKKMGVVPPSVSLPGQTFKLPGGGTITTGSVSSNRGAILTGLQNMFAGIPTWALIGIPTAGLAYLVFAPSKFRRNPRRRR